MKHHIVNLFKRITEELYQPVQRMRFKRSLRQSDVFLVSYPKSGRYWVGFFLANILAKKIPDTPEFLTLKNIYEIVPRVKIDGRNGSLHNIRNWKNWSEPRIFLTHGKEGYQPHLPKIIYLVRDPRDVMVSYHYHHRRVFPGFNLSMHEFIINNEAFPWDWGQHVREWKSHREDGPWLLVRYEDLQRAPSVWFRRILNFVEIEVSDTELRQAIKKCSFESMRRIEEKYGMIKQNTEQNIRHVRRGKVSGWRDELEPKSVDIIQERYSDLMSELGYS